MTAYGYGPDGDLDVQVAFAETMGDRWPDALVGYTVDADPDRGRDVLVVGTAGPDPRLESWPHFGTHWTADAHPRADGGGPFEPDSEADDWAPASDFYSFDVPGGELPVGYGARRSGGGA